MTCIENPLFRPDVVEKRQKRRLVVVESPFAGEIEANIEYGRRCMRDCLLRDEAPFASHLLYTQSGVLRDDLPDERIHGMDCGFSWAGKADASVVYIDRGISRGMVTGIVDALMCERPVEFRMICSFELLSMDPSNFATWLRGMHPQTFAALRGYTVRFCGADIRIGGDGE